MVRPKSNKHLRGVYRNCLRLSPQTIPHPHPLLSASPLSVASPASNPFFFCSSKRKQERKNRKKSIVFSSFPLFRFQVLFCPGFRGA
ncbi:hypothetical protein Dimus_002827 [Dionaea muscipula]